MPRTPPMTAEPVEVVKRRGTPREEKVEMEKTRNQMIDAARGGTMLLVVYSHALEMFSPAIHGPVTVPATSPSKPGA